MQPDTEVANGAAVQQQVEQTFLTQAQRVALDAALAAKAQARDANKAVKVHHDKGSARKHGAVHVKPVHGVAGDRKKSLRNGDAKKKGGGGKFTWGAMLDSSTPAPAATDKNDPNYDSEDDAVVDMGAAEGGDQDEFYTDDYDPMYANSRIVKAVAKLKSEIMDMLQEFLESGDTAEAAACIAELQLPQYDYYIVKRAVTLAMDRKDREKEAVSMLLSNLYGQYVSPPQMQKGFVSVLEDFNELILDVPDAVSVMALFISRAITDEILPPSFVSRILPPPGSPLEELKHKCQAHLSQAHHDERLLRCWGADAKLELNEARARIKAMLVEYIAGGDFPEVERQLRSLDAPFFHHEVVKQAILLATDDMAHAMEPVVSLLERLARSSEISSWQVYKGFQRTLDQLDDLQLDNPSLPDHFHKLYDACIARGVVDAADQSVLEEAERRRSADGDSHAAAHVRTVAAFKQDALGTIQEYFDSADAAEVARLLTDREESGMLHIFVKLIIQVSMERSFRERELVSQLFVELVPRTIGREQLAMGLTRLLAACDDLVLDIPDAAHMETLFLARLIVDEVLPPVFLTAVLDSLRPDTLAIVVVRHTAALLTSRHAGERVLQCWHGGLRTVDQLDSSIQMLLKEYIINSDLAEAVRSLHELNARSFHHEFVRQALDAAFEDPSACEKIRRLLQHMSESGEVTQTQLAKGFRRVVSNMDDVSLDCPKARAIVDDMVARGTAEKWLDMEAS